MIDEAMPQPEADEGDGESLPETVDEPVSAPASPPRSPLWKQVWAWLVGNTEPETLAEQRRELDAAIAADPDTPVNYVLRGEYFLTSDDPDAAEADFRRALDLAAHQAVESDWGFVAQAVEDRALVGLKKAEQRGRE